MATTVTPADPLRRHVVRGLAPYLRALMAVTEAAAALERYRRGEGRAPPVGALGEAELDLARVLAEYQALADMAGRVEVVRASDRIVRERGPRAARPAPALGAPPPPGRRPPGVPTPFPSGAGGHGGALPRVPFTEAIADIVAREPRLAAGAAEVAHAYTTEHVFAAARASSLEVTRHVQAAIAKGLATGDGVAEVSKIVADIADWSLVHAERVVSTNMTTAYSAGRFRQMADGAVGAVIGALHFTAVRDVDTRPNHKACHGLIAAPWDPIWQQFAPPLGFNCRCGLDFMDWLELQARGLLLPDGTVRPARAPEGGHADPGFNHAGRPDIAIYGAA